MVSRISREGISINILGICCVSTRMSVTDVLPKPLFLFLYYLNPIKIYGCLDKKGSAFVEHRIILGQSDRREVCPFILNGVSLTSNDPYDFFHRVIYLNGQLYVDGIFCRPCDAEFERLSKGKGLYIAYKDLKGRTEYGLSHCSIGM